MNAWRCAICKQTGEAVDERAASIALGKHWQSYHYGRESKRADHDTDA